MDRMKEIKSNLIKRKIHIDQMERPAEKEFVHNLLDDPHSDIEYLLNEVERLKGELEKMAPTD